ncbi:MAG: hypothetical protein KAH33_04455 [Candidatus Delongbacteria bacterium]|nr:hypothetical protein [Candidatus Delongbacteria bacterium]
MPIRQTQTKDATFQTMKNMSYESVLVGWLMQDGWQVFRPVLDNGHQTDVLISDGPNFYRVQVKTFNATGEDHVVHKAWENGNIDCVVYFARNSDWGYVAPAYDDKMRPLNHPEHIRFQEDKNSFLKAFHKLEVKR